MWIKGIFSPKYETCMVDFYIPKTELLQNYLEGFYFLKKEGNFPYEYYTFPNNYCILTLVRNAVLEIRDNEVFIRKSSQPNYISSLTYHYTKPLKVHYLEAVDEITIYFKPFGMNFFFPEMELLYQPKSMENFQPERDFTQKIAPIFDLPNRENQIQYLENFFTERFQNRKDSLINKLLLALETDDKIEQIAQNNNISRQYLNQYFKLKIGKSPSDYRRILRFRKSLTMLKNPKAALTEVSLENLFFDQAHFNRDFKAITHFTPKAFTSKTDLEKQNIWLII